ncbi:unnamed protein product [Heligmosomoides polygyrus]|uniref:EB domain-containing protein n=1 Tax=Heligmosomoides polygyrus TaxID=6339 RepID=A0A183FZB0_HELPZ|nr:unnamed protein product [Heligmosomoides polygyrus]
MLGACHLSPFVDVAPPTIAIESPAPYVGSSEGVLVALRQSVRGVMVSMDAFQAFDGAIVDFCERLTCGDAYECRLVQHGCPDMASCQPEPQCFRKGGGHIALDDCSMFHCGDNATCQMVVLNNCEGGRCLMGAQCITQGTAGFISSPRFVLKVATDLARSS